MGHDRRRADVEVRARSGDDSRCARAPLQADLAVRARQRRPVARRPVREAVLANGSALEDGVRVPRQCVPSCLDEELLLAGAELAWKAGPHGGDKGPSICHGTAGNGYGFLKAFERTGDELWLRRARRFAMHALAQAEQSGGRYSLWTGDLGVALYVADCLDGRSAYPIFDG